jgi:RNA polymerase sigma-70 factor (ECF subfamily)
VRIGDTGRAEELASDVFVRALEKIDSFQWRGVPIEAWLFRIAYNITVDSLRKTSRRKVAPLEDAGELASNDNPEYEAIRSIEHQEMLQALDSLTPAQREVVSLRFFGGLTSREVAEVVNRTNGAVRELQSSALRALRRTLNPNKPEAVEAEEQRQA